MSCLEKVLTWLACIAAALCINAAGIAVYGGEVEPCTEWLKIFSVGTVFWLIFLGLGALCSMRNRYTLRKRLQLWWSY